MARPLISSSHTISGVMPGGATISRHSFEDRVRAATKAGYVGLCLHYRDYLAQRAAGRSDENLREILDRHGVVHRSVEFSADWFVDGVTGEEAQAGLLAACRGFAATSFNVGGDLARRGIPFKLMRERFRALCRRAADQGVAVAMEIVAWGNVRDIDAVLDLLDGAPDNAGLAIDCWHIFRAGISLQELKRIPADRILCVQVNDAAAAPAGPLAEDTMRRKLCGEGDFDLRGFAATLEGMGVIIPFSVEIISPENAAMGLEISAQMTFETARRALG
ncbi:sugar phosphate isomerase/epimerase [Terrarubrum flagellatum]|uniref:sugar phosphate isomerase/epimerase family protein n=1 Tax=Terrirubrum flagellatum TaxID=2895980 RepID=UPI0031451283